MLLRTEYSGKSKTQNAVGTITSVDLEILLPLKFMLSIYVFVLVQLYQNYTILYQNFGIPKLYQTIINS